MRTVARTRSMLVSEYRAFRVASNVSDWEASVAAGVASDIATPEMELKIYANELWLKGGRAKARLYLGLMLEGVIRGIRYREGGTDE